MQDEQKLDLILERFYNRYNKYNTKVLEKLGETIKMFDGLTPSQAHKLAQQLKMGQDVNELLQELSKITNKSMDEINTILEKTAKDNVNFSEVYYKAKNKEFINYENNKSLQKYVKSLAKDTNNTFKDITKTKAIGFSLTDKKTGKKIFKPLKKAYNELLDEAVYSITSGQEDYQSAMRNITKELANSGIKTHEYKTEYKSGYSRRIDSSVRQTLLDSVRQVNIEVQRRVGEEFGSDGVEISVHSPCAEDHLPIQGKQYTNKEFAKLNGDLERPIGELNCRHFIFSILMGVSRPQYSQEQLDKINQESTDIVEYEGKKYTKYEASQVQRKLETKIRAEKDYQIISRAKGDNDAIREAQQNITKYTQKYNEFSKAVDFPTYKQRLTVSGYRRVKTN